MPVGLNELLTLLDLETIEVNIFRGTNLEIPRQRVFGGQVAAQALIAAGRTVESGRVHSLHAYFLLPGDPRSPILYEVDRIRDGRSFTTRRVVAIQHGEVIFNLACSFHTDEVGLVHQQPMPKVKGPEELKSLASVLAEHPETAMTSFLCADGLDIRYVSALPWEQRKGLVERQQLWLRTSDRVSDDPLLHAAFATLVSDLTLVDTILNSHGYSPWDEAFIGASLDHCMWFHRPFRADEWLFYDQQSPTAFGARGLAFGTLYSQSGELVASVAQEGLIRIRSAT